MIVSIIGKPGSGKDTVCKALSEKHSWKVIVTGDLLRKIAKENTELGKKIAETLEKGEIVSDEIVAELVVKEINKSHSDVILLNGYPRRINQAIILEEKFSKKIDLVIEIDVSDSMARERIIYRRYCPKCGKIYNLKFFPPKEDEICDICKEKLVQRKDDTEEVFKHRLKRFYDEIQEIREFYTKRGIFFKVNGEKNVKEIVNEVEGLIQKRI